MSSDDDFSSELEGRMFDRRASSSRGEYACVVLLVHNMVFSRAQQIENNFCEKREESPTEHK
jgi:hypothetical protein